MGRDLIQVNDNFYSLKSTNPSFYKEGCLICCEQNTKVYWLYVKSDEKEVVIDCWLKDKNIFYIDFTFKPKLTRMFGNEYGF